MIIALNRWKFNLIGLNRCGGETVPDVKPIVGP